MQRRGRRSWLQYIVAFGKWGAFDQANISPSPEAFYVGLPEGSRLENELSEIDLNLPIPMTTDPATKVVTYQCLCKVKGKVRFALVNSDDTGTLDEIVVESAVVDGGYAYTDATLVTLRAQVYDGGPASVRYAVVVIENVSHSDIDDDLSALQVYWQQAWGGSEAQPDDYPLSAGLANAGQARVTTTEPVKNTYNWAVNALGIKAASKFQLPLLDTSSGGDATGMGWKMSTESAALADLQDGELYYDAFQRSILGRADGAWCHLAQPDTVNLAPMSPWTGGDAKNQIFTDSTSQDYTLSTTLSDVPIGSVVRVFNLGTSGGTPPTVTVKVGGSALSAVSSLHMSEFLFYVEDVMGTPTGKWLVVQGNVTTKRLP
ncbi:MAG: hypothetical protein JST30_17260 [Armatimonadetes bacterium]|nr:hypothetical protein [Armatimonadota bacterium]